MAEESPTDLVRRWQILQEQGAGPLPEELAARQNDLLAELERHRDAVASLEAFLGVEAPSKAMNAGASTLAGPPAGAPQAATDRSGSRFQVVRPHARGGLGEVFVAIDQELHREVALKEIQEQRANDPDSRARFLLEAEVTGGLEHPGIVPVYGQGTYPDGRPYYAMRFIRGESLEEALDRFHRADSSGRDRGERELALRGLLGRFVAACNAVAYAHSRGVLHRDLKPANIMLGPFGETLVVDWGLAKTVASRDEGKGPDQLLRPVSGEDARTTRLGQAVGTPAFMSPEQMIGQPGPASDVYGLGATLYALLTGKAPVEAENLLALLEKAQRGDIVPPRRVKRAVPRALESICLKAMALAPESRYASARDLADDVERWLADEPVRAHRDRLAARVGRWARRHRPLVAGCVALLGTAVVALALSTVLVSRAWDSTEQARLSEAAQKEDAERARTRAEADALRASQAEQKALDHAGRAERAGKRAAAEGRRARKVSQMFTGLFESADPLGIHTPGVTPGKEKGQNLTARELLDRGRDRVLAETKEDPLVRAEMLHTLGDVYRTLGLYQEAAPLLKEALDLRRRELGADDLDVAASLHGLGWLLHDLGHYDSARPLLEQALLIRRAHGGDDLVATSAFHLAWLLADSHDYEKAERLFQEAIVVRRRQKNRERDLAVALTGLGAMRVDQGRGLDAGPLLREAADIQGKRPEGEKALAAVLDLNRGVMFRNFKQHRRAEASLRKALKGARELLGDKHPYVGFVLYELATTLAEAGDHKEAEDLYREALAIARRSVGLQHPKVISVVVKVAEALARRRQVASGRKLLNELLAARQLHFGPRHPLVAAALNHFGDFEDRYGDDNLAVRHLRESIAICDERGISPPWLPFALNRLGIVLDRQGKSAQAEASYRRAIALHRKAGESSRGHLAIVLANLADTQMDLRKYDQAGRTIREALAIARAASVPPNDLLFILDTSGRFHRAFGEFEEARANCEESLRLAQAPNRLANLGAALVGLGKHKEAQAQFSQALALTLGQKGPSAFDVVRRQRERALARLAGGDGDGYRADCAELVRRVAGAGNAAAIALVVQTIALSPGPGTDPAAAVRLAEKAARLRPRDAACRRALAAALHRAGHFSEPLRRLREARDLSPGKRSNAQDRLWQALALARMGQSEMAGASLREAERLLGPDAKGALPAYGPAPEGFEWRLEVMILRREAEGLVQPAKSPR
jgi:tetratricopeptide (TPR) repeat protein